jgi:thiamine-phosphate pyrophosphorylase
VQLYAITDRNLFPGREALLQAVASWAAGAVDYVQIREKDLDRDALSSLAAEIVLTVRKYGGRTRVLLNGSPEIAVSIGCDGVHLHAGMPADAIAWAREVMPDAVISVSCHTLTEIEAARNGGSSLVLFAPVFEKKLREGATAGQGLAALAEACKMYRRRCGRHSGYTSFQVQQMA